MRFRLRSLFLVVAASALVAYWLGTCWREMALEKDALSSLIANGGRIEQTEYRGPRILGFALGHFPSFQRCTSLSLMDGRITDQQLARCVDIPFLEVVAVESDAVSDDGIEILGQLNSLRVLEISGKRITGAVAYTVADSASLEELYFLEVKIQNGELACLENSNLEVLSLLGCNVTDTMLFQSKLPKRLRMLDLRETLITKAAILRLQSENEDLTVLY